MPVTTQHKSAYNYAIYLLARREYSEFQLRQKLNVKCDYSDVVENVMAKVKDLGYQSDARYVTSFIESSLSKNKGPAWIQQKLRMKGLADAVIKEFLLEADVDWQSLANNNLAQKFKGICLSQKEKMRRFNFLISAGFSHSVAMQSINESEIYSVSVDSE